MRRTGWIVLGVAVAGLVVAGVVAEKSASASSVPNGPTGPVGPNVPAPTYVARSAAQALAAAMAQGGCTAPNLAQLCTSFQQASNTDAGAVARVGTLPTSGQFDQPTAAAIAWYGAGIYPPCAGTTPLGAATPGNPGNAASCASLLEAYLKAHGCDGSATLSTLTQNFQSAHNTDTSGDGPASAKPLTGALTVSGTFDSATSQALALYSGTAALPACA